MCNFIIYIICKMAKQKFKNKVKAVKVEDILTEVKDTNISSRKRHFGFVKNLRGDISFKELEEVVQNLIRNCYKVYPTIISDLVFQIEKGGLEGRKHFQGFVSFKNAKTVSAVRLFFEEKLLFIIDTLQIAVKPVKLRDYCLKEETRAGCCFDICKVYKSNNYPYEYNSFQKLLLKLMEEQTERQILFLIDEYGGCGKSYFVGRETVFSLLGCPFQKRYTIRIPYAIKGGEDFLQYVHSFVVGAKLNYGVDLFEVGCNIYIDLPKSCIRKMDIFSFAKSLEELKNGFVYDKRYEASLKSIIVPNVMVFLNGHVSGLTVPDKYNEYFLTADRIDILNIFKGDREKRIKRERFLSVSADGSFKL